MCIKYNSNINWSTVENNKKYNLKKKRKKTILPLALSM